MKILVVDDETIIQQGIVTLLQEIGITNLEVITAKNGKIALELIANNKPDVVMTDIRMPVMDGLQLVGYIYEQYPHIAVIILTGYADFGYAQQALKYGVFDYLLKPITKDRIQDVLRNFMLQTPKKWLGNWEIVREMKETVQLLCRSVLAEDKASIEKIMQQWKQFCDEQQFVLLELKQIMSHFYLTFTAELMVHLPITAEQQLELDQVASSSEQLFLNWHEYLIKHMEQMKERRSPRNKRVVDDVMKEISNKFGEPVLNLQQLSESSGVSSAYLSKMFREVMNKPITQYICEFRLEQVRQRLERDSNEKISIIAEQCGFNDYPYFSKVFKRTFGVSPVEYREKMLF
ncbi:response regulator [Paenibacillus yanchengensis]|uniref:Response regulator n=1 Tax=Paenibacillus yanchengensis TaxID=2035833 RepID=A0ABW4YEU7_9BACL